MVSVLKRTAQLDTDVVATRRRARDGSTPPAAHVVIGWPGGHTALRGGGNAVANAWRTVRRYTPCRSTDSLIDNP